MRENYIAHDEVPCENSPLIDYNNIKCTYNASRMYTNKMNKANLKKHFISNYTMNSKTKNNNSNTNDVTPSTKNKHMYKPKSQYPIKYMTTKQKSMHSNVNYIYNKPINQHNSGPTIKNKNLHLKNSTKLKRQHLKRKRSAIHNILVKQKSKAKKILSTAKIATVNYRQILKEKLLKKKSRRKKMKYLNKVKDIMECDEETIEDGTHGEIYIAIAVIVFAIVSIIIVVVYC